MSKQSLCYTCVHRRKIPGDAHSRCNKFEATVTGHPIGIRGGWFRWPLNFDPTWLVDCDSWSDKAEDNIAGTRELDPLSEILAILR
jgi:hypothetical protein